MQTFPEALRYGPDERVELAFTDEHPVEAAAARHHVLACGLVDNVYHVVAGSSGDRVLRCGGYEFATEHVVVTVPAHHVVRAEAAKKGIVAVPAHHALGAS